MSLPEMQAAQDAFDREHFPRFSSLNRASDENLEPLLFLGVGISGEVGELNNLIKKLYRGDMALHATVPKLAEELTDVFSYAIKLANQLDIDIEKTHAAQLHANRDRFAHLSARSLTETELLASFDMEALRDAKHWPTELLVERVKQLALARARDFKLEVRLRDALAEEGIYCEKLPLDFFVSAYLACILDTIADEQSYALRDTHMSALDKAAEQLGASTAHLRILLRGVDVIREHVVACGGREPSRE